MKQRSFASLTMQFKKKPARWGQFLGDINNPLRGRRCWHLPRAKTQHSAAVADRRYPAQTTPCIEVVAVLLIRRLTQRFRSPLALRTIVLPRD